MNNCYCHCKEITFNYFLGNKLLTTVICFFLINNSSNKWFDGTANIFICGFQCTLYFNQLNGADRNYQKCIWYTHLSTRNLFQHALIQRRVFFEFPLLDCIVQHLNTFVIIDYERFSVFSAGNQWFMYLWIYIVI